MAEKLGPGATKDWSPQEGEVQRDLRPSTEEDRLRQKRQNALIAMAGGVGLMFIGGSLLVQMAIGGAAMAVYGAVAATYWSIRLRAVLGDPWEPDAEIDAWEQSQIEENRRSDRGYASSTEREPDGQEDTRGDGFAAREDRHGYPHPDDDWGLEDDRKRDGRRDERTR